MWNRKTSHCPAQAFAIIFFLELSALQLHGKDHPSLWRKCPDSGCWYIHQYSHRSLLWGLLVSLYNGFLCKQDDFNMNDTADTVLYCCTLLSHFNKNQKHGWPFHFSWYQPIVFNIEQTNRRSRGIFHKFRAEARLMIHRLKYFRSALNIFDALLVASSSDRSTKYSNWDAQFIQIWVKWSIYNHQTTINIFFKIFQALDT